MITTKKQIKEVLKAEKDFYLSKHSKFQRIITLDSTYVLYRYIRNLRKLEYYYNNRKNVFNLIMYVLCRRKRNILGRKLGVEMHPNNFDAGLKIWHTGNIIVNPHAKIGKNCVLHGDNCIGNNGKDDAAPVLGDNVRLGVGAKVLGDVKLANNVTVAAGAVVIHSCEQENAVLAGVPAKCVKIAGE